MCRQFAASGSDKGGLMTRRGFQVIAILCGLCLGAGCGEESPPTGTVSGHLKIGGTAPTEPVRLLFLNALAGTGGGC